MHRPGRVAFRDIERGEIVPVVLDLRPGGDGEAHVGEDLGQFVHHLADRMDRAARRFGRRQREVDRFAGQLSLERGAFQSRLGAGQRLGHCLAKGVDLRARHLPFFGRHPAQRLQQARDRALLAEKFDPQSLQRAQILRGGDARQRCFTGCCMVHGRCFHYLVGAVEPAPLAKPRAGSKP